MWPKCLMKCFRYAFDGIVYSFLSQRNMKIHSVAAAGALIAAWYAGLSPVEIAVLVLAIAGVFTAELFNTAVETVVDMVSPEQHRLAKVAKDVAAGAVLVMAIAAVLVGWLLIYPRLFG
jgi:diacylglycerol kinase